MFSSMLYMESTKQRDTGIENESEWSNETVNTVEE